MNAMLTNAGSITNAAPAVTEDQLDLAIKMAEGAVTLMNDLSDVMKQEADILETQKFIGHDEIMKRKQRLTLDYRAMMKSLVTQPDMLKVLPEGMRANVRLASQRLTDVADRNARILRSSMVGAQQLLQSIIRIVKDEALPQGGYFNPNTKPFELGIYSPTCKPVAVDRRA